MENFEKIPEGESVTPAAEAKEVIENDVEIIEEPLPEVETVNDEAVNDTADKQDSDSDEKKGFKIRELFNGYIITSIALAFVAVIVYLLAVNITPFAEFWSVSISQFFRSALGFLTGWFPFSLGEIIVYCVIPLAILYFIYAMKKLKEDEKAYWVSLLTLVCVIFNILSVYVLGFGVCNYRYPLDEQLGLDRKQITVKELSTTADILTSVANTISNEISYDDSGASIMPYSFEELSSKLDKSFEAFSKEYDFISHFPAKPKVVAASELMTYTHISGVYSFFTGEANINVNYPDFVLPYTIAHEMSHQRGIAREDEANFIAYLICYISDDSYLVYSGLINMLEYVLSALAQTDSEIYREKFLALDEKIQGEFISYSKFFDKYRDNPVADLSDKVNDTFLQMNGQEHGTRSYGLVVELIVALHKAQMPERF